VWLTHSEWLAGQVVEVWGGWKNIWALEGAVKKKVARFLSKVLNAAFCINLHCNPLRKPLDGVFYGAAIEKRPFATGCNEISVNVEAGNSFCDASALNRRHGKLAWGRKGFIRAEIALPNDMLRFQGIRGLFSNHKCPALMSPSHVKVYLARPCVGVRAWHPG